MEEEIKTKKSWNCRTGLGKFPILAVFKISLNVLILPCSPSYFISLCVVLRPTRLNGDFVIVRLYVFSAHNSQQQPPLTNIQQPFKSCPQSFVFTAPEVTAVVPQMLSVISLTPCFRSLMWWIWFYNLTLSTSRMTLIFTWGLVSLWSHFSLFITVTIQWILLHMNMLNWCEWVCLVIFIFYLLSFL